MEPRRILIFSLMYGPFWGGAELAVKEITDRIASKEIIFDMVTLRADGNLPKEEKIGNVTVHRIGPSKRGITHEDLKRFPWYFIKVLYPILAAWKARTLHRRRQYDALWSLMTNMGFPAVLARMIGVDVPFVLTLQDGDTIEHITQRVRIRLVSPLLAKIFRDASVVQVISNYLGAFARQMGFRGEPVLVPNGVAVRHFSRASVSRENVRAQWGVNYDDVVLVSTSRLVHKNALDDVIRALKFLPDNVCFVNMGVGPDRKTLQDLARREGVEARIRLLPHPGLDALPSYLRAADIFIRPSRSEGFGTSFIEAMAAEVPVIATQEGGIADFLFDVQRNPEHVPTGYAVDRDSPEHIERVVKDIIKNPEQTKRTVENALRMTTEQYDWNDIARKMTHVLTTI